MTAVSVTSRRSSGVGPLRRLVTPLLVGSVALAAGVHLATGAEHRLTDGHGLLLLAAGAGQAVLALALAHRRTRRRLWVAVALSVGALVLWGVARAPGPLLSGDPAGPLDLVASLAEAATVLIAGALLVMSRQTATAPTGGRRAGLPALLAAPALVAVVALGVASFGPSAHGNHGTHHDTVPAGTAGTAGADDGAPDVFGDLFDGHHLGGEGSSASSHGH